MKAARHAELSAPSGEGQGTPFVSHVCINWPVLRPLAFADFTPRAHRHFYSFIQGSVPEKEAEKRRTNCATLGNGQRAHPSSAPRAESRCRQKSIPTDQTEIAGLGRTAAAATQWRVATKSIEESSQR